MMANEDNYESEVNKKNDGDMKVHRDQELDFADKVNLKQFLEFSNFIFLEEKKENKSSKR